MLYIITKLFLWLRLGSWKVNKNNDMIYIRREVKLALTAIAAVVILIWGINFLKAKALFDNNNVFYGIYDRVDGLKVSSSVIYRG